MNAAFTVRPKGFMFDLDGTLILSNRQLGSYSVLPGAVELLETLEDRATPFLVLTNGSAYPASVQGPRLRSAGLPIRDDRLFTPNSVAATIMQDRNYRRVMVLGTQGVLDALTEFGIPVCLPGDAAASAADAVYVAWHPECSMDDIHAAAGRVLEGAAFLTASDVPFFATQSGPAFGYSCAIVGAIARVTGQEPEVTGKPSLHAMRFVASQLGLKPEDIAVIGDDPRVEIQMAREGGSIGIAVTSGTTSRAEWRNQQESRQPHAIYENVGEILSELVPEIAAE
ncbi:HAD-IIA family hydrolase [Altericroceibacterium endophyticum]|uniref:HAD hydrolase-like protein n=1 Tax=Altericroceibacterium endophyticum TaxID=1808508 RepID=A0A6I4T839_9SPHN|nr:HAD hydrolase-like protein [Altericroceibacterium endophyticum]MXO66659.1 HAD hydrolase-like protein [Altericroceibacterium endophyticum]